MFGERSLQVGHVAARALLELAIGGREARLQRLVDEQPPDLLERNVSDELLDVIASGDGLPDHDQKLPAQCSADSNACSQTSSASSSSAFEITSGTSTRMQFE